MRLLDELICQDIGRNIIEYMKNCDINYAEIAQTKAIKALEEIKAVINNNKLSDFEIVDEIVRIFIRYNIDTGGCHDF